MDKFSSDWVCWLSAAISAVSGADLFKATYIWLVLFVGEILRELASYITHFLSFCPFFSEGVTLKLFVVAEN